ncbi:protein artemis isoform X2 [Centroberyx gerrardi]
MFLIEGSQGNVLYTGDFRLAEGDASRIELLHSGSRVKDIQSVYLDSTFYDPRFYQIPSREVCLSGIGELVGNWISRSVYHVVWLNCKAAYGYEYLFTNLGEEFNTQIHVKSLAMFKKMPEILSYVTTDRNTQIHACRHPKDEEYFRGNRLPCGCSASDGTPLRIISIKPSTMWFGERSKKSNVVVKTGASSYRACFSFHSSYTEIKDFLSYLQPVNIYPSVIPLGRTLTDVTELLKPMCRNQSERAAFIYKPLGILKRTREERPTCDSDSDDGLFDGLDLAPVRKKMVLNQEEKNHVQVQNPLTTAPPTPAEEPLPLTVTVTQSTAANYMDCTESNDEEEDDDEDQQEEEETENPMKIEGNGEAKAKRQEVNEPKKEECERKRAMGKKKTEGGGDEERKEPLTGSSNAPAWEDFFTVEMLPDSQNSHNSQSQSCCSLTSPSPSRMTGSQTPELFSDDDDEDDNEEKLSSSQSTSLSNHASLDQESSLSDTLILQPEQRRREHGQLRTNSASPKKESGDRSPQSEPGELSASQVSSDFDIPCTPESKTPQPDELSQLYRKLASGEEVVIRKGSQGSM